MSNFADRFDPQVKDLYKISRAQLLVREGAFPEALELYASAWDSAKERDDTNTMAQVQNQIGRCYYLQGKYAAAQEAYQQAAQLYRGMGQLIGLADTLRYMGTAYSAHGDWLRALQSHLESMREAQKVVDGARDLDEKAEAWLRVASAANQAAQVALLIGDTPRARGLARKALEIWEDLRNLTGQAGAKMTLGRVAEMEGEFTFATKYLEEAKQLYSRGSIPSIYGQTRAQIFLARVRRRQEQLNEAEELAKECLETFKQLGRERQQAFALSELGTILRYKGYFLEAANSFNKALEIAKRIGDRYRQTEVLEDLVFVARQKGDSPDKVEGLLAQVERLAEEGGYELFLGRAKEHRGEMAFKDGNLQRAFSFYVEACHHLAKYHPDFHRRFLNKVENRLYELPWGEIPIYCDQMIQYWREQELAEQYPELIQRAESAKRLALSFLGEGG